MFKIRMGIPEMKQIWENLEKKYNSNTLSKAEKELFKKLINCFKKLSNDPLILIISGLTISRDRIINKAL